MTLNGTGQSITGSSNFYNLTKSVSLADSLTFPASATQTIATGGTLTLQGASGQLLSLRSSATPTRWSLTVNGNLSVDYVDVKDSDASGGLAIVPTNSTDGGNNLNWTFDTTPPTTTDDYDAKDNVWQNANQTITLTPFDDNSGVASTKYCTDAINTCDPTTGTDYTVPVLINTEGTTYFRYKSTDNAGNVQTTVSRTVKIDKTNPVVNAGADQTQSAQFIQDATATDVTSGIASYLWSTVSGAGTVTFGSSTTEDTTVSASANNTHVIRLTVTDNAGNSASDDFTLVWSGSGGGTGTGSSGSNGPITGNYGVTVSQPTIPIPLAPASVSMSLPTPNEIVNIITGAIGNVISKISPLGTLFGKPVVTKVPELPPASIAVRAWTFSVRWQLIDPQLIHDFVFAPLPKPLRALASAFPELGRTFDSLGVTQLRDVERLTNAQVFQPVVTDINKLPKNIVLASGLSPDFISSLPLATQLSISAQGQVTRVINAVSGSLVTLSVRPDKPVNAVSGYLVLKESKFAKALVAPLSSQLASVILAQGAEVTPLPTTVVENRLVLARFEYVDPEGDGVWTAQVPVPKVVSMYEVITVYDYVTGDKQELRLTLVVDPEGYVYEEVGGRQTRIANAQVSIYRTDGTLWPAQDFQQRNPQTTADAGEYSFLVPPGDYYLVVKVDGYKDFHGATFTVSEGAGVHENIQMYPKSGIGFLVWGGWLILVLLILLAINLYILLRILRLRNKLIK